MFWCHFRGSAPALSSNPEYWQHEQSVPSQWKLASTVTTFIVSRKWESQPMQIWTALEELKIYIFFFKWPIQHMDHSTPWAMFTFQTTHKNPLNALQMIGSRQGTLNLMSYRIACKFASSNIQFVHMFSKSFISFYCFHSCISIYNSGYYFLSLHKFTSIVT